MTAEPLQRLLSRRQVLAGGLTAAAGVVAGCGSVRREVAGWTFVDDRGQIVRLPRRPTRVVAYTTAAAALYEWGVTPVGVFGDDPQEDRVLAGFPWRQSQVVGSVYGEIDVATLRAVGAQLIVSQWYPPPADAPLFGFKDLAQEKEIAAQVPIVALSGRLSALTQIDRFGDLAHALGSDTTAGALVRARALFDGAAARLSGIARRTSDLRIIAVSGDESYMFVAKVAAFGDLSLYRRLGVPLVSAESSYPYWDQFRWSHAAKYRADGIMYDARSLFLPSSVAKEIPTFAALPAVRANQIAPWPVDPPPSYQAFAATMNELATAIAGWRKVT